VDHPEDQRNSSSLLLCGRQEATAPRRSPSDGSYHTAPPFTAIVEGSVEMAGRSVMGDDRCCRNTRLVEGGDQDAPTWSGECGDRCKRRGFRRMPRSMSKPELGISHGFRLFAGMKKGRCRTSAVQRSFSVSLLKQIKAPFTLTKQRHFATIAPLFGSDCNDRGTRQPRLSG
jgi:hypothetical protein